VRPFAVGQRSILPSLRNSAGAVSLTDRAWPIGRPARRAQLELESPAGFVVPELFDVALSAEPLPPDVSADPLSPAPVDFSPAGRVDPPLRESVR